MNPVQCNICDAAAAKFHCNTCGDDVCLTCKTHHLKSKGSRHHHNVPYAQKLDPNYLAGLSCHIHPNNAPEFWCETCEVPICVYCITDKHKSHTCSNITTVLSEARDEMVEEMNTLRDKTIWEWEYNLQQARGITTDYLDEIDETEKDLLARAKEIHQEVDSILYKIQQSIREKRANGLARLQQQEKDIADRLMQLKDEVQTYEDQIRDADPNVLLQFRQGVKQNRNTMPSSPVEFLGRIVFAPGRTNLTKLEEMFGFEAFQFKHIEQTKSDFYSDSSDENETASMPNSDQTIVKASDKYSRRDITNKSLISNPSVLRTVSVDECSAVMHIACIDKGLAWLWTGNEIDNTIQLMDREGTVKHTIETECDCKDFAVSSDGDILLADFKFKFIRTITRQNKRSILFKTKWKPTGICCLPNSDIVVTFNKIHRVCIYNRRGQIKGTLDHIAYGYPSSVSTNKVNQDIYMCAYEYPYSNEGKLIAVGYDGQVRYEYSGHDDDDDDNDDDYYYRSHYVREFCPTEVCTDQMGHVIITDLDRIHILDQDGSFIQFIILPNTEEESYFLPSTVDVDRDGHVWIWQTDGDVKIAKYLEENWKYYYLLGQLPIVSGDI